LSSLNTNEYHYHDNNIKTDILFLDREIQNRKKTFGIEIYDLMAELETDTAQDALAKETKIRAIFDAARKDIAVFQAKKDCKNEEISVLDAESGVMSEAPPTNMIPPSSGTVLTNAHPSENI
jgi:hypothetical protein